MYLLSDFPVAPVDYKHLAKLVLYAALSKESKRLAERITRRRCASLVTTAFSKIQPDVVANLHALAELLDVRADRGLQRRDNLRPAIVGVQVNRDAPVCCLGHPSKNPESMKYRGLFKVLNRKHNDSLQKADWAKDIDPANAYYMQPYAPIFSANAFSST